MVPLEAAACLPAARSSVTCSQHKWCLLRSSLPDASDAPLPDIIIAEVDGLAPKGFDEPCPSTKRLVPSAPMIVPKKKNRHSQQRNADTPTNTSHERTPRASTSQLGCAPGARLRRVLRAADPSGAHGIRPAVLRGRHAELEEEFFGDVFGTKNMFDVAKKTKTVLENSAGGRERLLNFLNLNTCGVRRNLNVAMFPDCSPRMF